MKTRMLFVLPIVMASLFLTFSCREPEKEIFYMPQEFKDYVMFPVGSYWVYEDSASGAIDSIYLKSSEIEIFEPPHSDFKYEKLNQVFYSGYYQTDFSAGSILEVLPYEYGGYGYFFDISQGVNRIQYAELISITDTMIINSKPYCNVAYIRYSPGVNRYYYWVKNIGLIKKIDETGTWLLKSN